MYQKDDNEINLFDFIAILWDGKWKVIALVIISILGVIVFQSTQPNKFDATTKIRPITSAEADKYVLFNNIGFFVVSSDLLFNEYIEQLDQRIVFEDAIREVELLDIKKYQNKEEYEKDIVTLASEIEIFNPRRSNDEMLTEMKSFPTIFFKYYDIEKWKLVLSIAHNTATQSVKKIIKDRFRSMVNTEKQMRKYEIEDLELKIANITNDYYFITAKRLAFLEEQSAIARSLGIATNTVGSQTISTQSGLMTNISLEEPFYLRGYLAIEAETKLIKSRVDKKLFIDELLQLENGLRMLNQDQTLVRAEKLFASTPIESANQSFSASRVSPESSVVVEQNIISILLLTGVIAGMIGVIYVFISNGLRMYNKKQHK